MECAALSSYLIEQPCWAVTHIRFRKRRVRPLCHLMDRQQTWQVIEKNKTLRSASSSRRSANVEIAERFPSPAHFAGRHLQANRVRPQERLPAFAACTVRSWLVPPKRCGPVYWLTPRWPRCDACVQRAFRARKRGRRFVSLCAS